MNENDTIAAICSGIGGSITVVRIAGKEAVNIAEEVWSSKNKLNKANKRKFLYGTILPDQRGIGEPALAVFMPSPKSYTGEDIVEIHAHGGSFTSKKLMEEILKNGARQANAGEFTFRAFYNGKMDLTQAEGVADLISSNNDKAFRLAERQINGSLGDKIKSIRRKLLDVYSETEARIDFPEEELDFSGTDRIVSDLEEIRDSVQKLYNTKREGNILREGLKVVIAGSSNTGKSSLLNLLLGYDRAITTEIPGTTTDTLEECTNINGVPVRLIDTAGIRECDNIIEQTGVNKTLTSLQESHLIIWLLDASDKNKEENISEMKNHISELNSCIVVWNKIDLINDSRELPQINFPTAKISVKQENGIEKFLDIFKNNVWGSSDGEETEFAISERHASLLNESLKLFPEVIDSFSNKEWELASISLKNIISNLGKILGIEYEPDIYEKIFSKFCIGK